MCESASIFLFITPSFISPPFYQSTFYQWFKRNSTSLFATKKRAPGRTESPIYRNHTNQILSSA
jgi:hypothetical protein